MDENEYYLREIEQEIYYGDIEAKNKAEFLISALERMTELYDAIAKGDLHSAKRLARKKLEKEYRTAQQGLIELMKFGYSDDIKKQYERKYSKAIYAAQRAVSPETFMDASQILKREQQYNSS